MFWKGPFGRFGFLGVPELFKGFAVVEDCLSPASSSRDCRFCPLLGYIEKFVSELCYLEMFLFYEGLSCKVTLL